MPTSEAGRRPLLPVRLVVPEVERGDIGMVLTVNAVGWSSGDRHWVLTAANEHEYLLPDRLTEWARRLDYDIRRGVVNLPVVMAFSRNGPAVTARILSAAHHA
ncbi:hypothetical protein ABZ517_05585 [Streptomyces scabiei]|uniref:hypothetical protein n=1 Tax=Streptomyces scabiei TaxID=1930 RepID=UPI0033C970D0